jgi:hypothetical protein
MKMKCEDEVQASKSLCIRKQKEKFPCLETDRESSVMMMKRSRRRKRRRRRRGKRTDTNDLVEDTWRLQADAQYNVAHGSCFPFHAFFVQENNVQIKH